MWILKAVLVHFLLLGSIFVIYFRSPVLGGLKPQKSLLEIGLRPPAKRLVLIVTDGLRAESFFRNKCGDIPHLRKLILEKGGLVGISHTRVPTESRPGHIAIIAGLYEDPSAVTRGWKENPIDFDTLFNRSRRTYAWGANDVLHIFSRLDEGGGKRLVVNAYDHDLDFSGRNDTTALDEWVFERVSLMLKQEKDQLQHQDQLIFFMHLLGLDSAGHIHKPGSKKFLENLHTTERRIVEMYRYFEEIFPDGETAFLLTSDHGMTDAGSHGAGASFETETPFYLWGSGIAQFAPNQGRTFQIAEGKTLPLYELEQAQLTPLMAVLIGIAPPMNNLGSLPIGYLNVSVAYEAAGAYINSLQLLEQFNSLYETHQRGVLAPFLRNYGILDKKTVESYKVKFRKLNDTADYESIIKLSHLIMQMTLDGIDYYHGYYRNVLLFCTTAIFIGWMYYLLQLLVTRKSYNGYHHTRMSTPVLFFVATLVLIYVYLQKVPLITAFYFLVPIFVWMFALQQQHTPISLWRQYSVHKGQLVLLVCCSEILVLAFFHRQIISIAFLIFALINNSRAFARNHLFFIWLCLVIVLSMFPLLPPSVGYKNDILLIMGMLSSLVRTLCIKTRLRRQFILIGAFGIINALYCIYCQTNGKKGISNASHVISWCYLIYSFAILIHNKLKVVKMRMELVLFNLTTLYSVLCTSYEAIFITMLATELLLSLSAHEALNTPNTAQPPMSSTSAQHLKSSFRLAFAILLYTFFSFFGTGNIASVSSFDPNIIRCFLSTFLPFVIMALVILKLIIPIILNISIIYAISDFVRHNEREIFICLLLICDIMGLNFLFLVRNKGSWLDIGTSISHFVIMEVTTLVLLFLTIPAKLFLKLHTTAPLILKLK